MAQGKEPLEFIRCHACSGFGRRDKGGACRPCEGSGELIVRGAVQVVRKAEFAAMVRKGEV